MIKFPSEFVALKKYPGYFWNVEDKSLYSIKIGGVLKKLKKNSGYFTQIGVPHYQISHNGRRYYIVIDRIESYLATGTYTIPIKRSDYV